MCVAGGETPPAAELYACALAKQAGARARRQNAWCTTSGCYMYGHGGCKQLQVRTAQSSCGAARVAATAAVIGGDHLVIIIKRRA